ncbi:aspartate--tRNA(Asn) ligase [Candidatus Kaiserbacteria bacterium RIFCSPHIGHO2_02_FULL_49_34]|uniref:Aspartate--tRNA ligase n=1 Tax=Candidatus Kaiserbacteria bacterium RIFCSPHIGHO2_02_FULL_49_34 TaxID=1798491 RepID=A0A1F6DIT0_9BACT|nr:MAG: aspartate--tRNA(Asn) ligase [Candidatus Kaiserbacteria bacterium RIFCSPHIGHO2_02_FULL_49_34]
MERTLIADLSARLEAEVMIQGSVAVARQQGKMAFFDFRDRSGAVQGVVFGKPEVLEVAKELKQEYVVEVRGIVHKRPEKMVNADVQNGDIELEITGLTVINAAESMPFDLEGEFNLDTLLDNRPLTLRRTRERAIFKVQATITKAWREYLDSEGFTEFQAPKLVGGDAEGGSEVFKVDYFDGKDAFLSTSPQLYKQMMVGVFERAYTIGQMFRAERSATTRHLSEISMMDFEMGHITSYLDVIATVSGLVKHIVKRVEESCAKELTLLGVAKVLVPETIPVLTLREIQEIILKETGVDKSKEQDMEPEDERFICEYAAKNLGSDFVFVTQFPTAKRAFYTKANEENPEYSDSFDLLFRGLEMCSGAERISNHGDLVAKIASRGMDPEKFAFYLQAFKYGIPRHGGIGMGLERLTMKMCGLGNVKEASLFPRDMNRIDTLLQ